jgi:hypothetical protein
MSLGARLWHDERVVEAGFGDHVRIVDSEATRAAGFAGRVGHVYGETVPSASGEGPVIGDRGEDFALSVFFDDTNEQVWFAPNEVAFIDHGAGQTFSLDGGPTYTRDTGGEWHTEGVTAGLGKASTPGAFDVIRRWLRLPR